MEEHEIYNYKYGKLAFKNSSGYKAFFNDSLVYQEHINEQFRKYFVPKTNILDVGANVGMFTVSFSKIAPDCKIHSFEPVDITRKLLHKSIELNELNNVELYNFGLSNENKEVTIQVDLENLGNSSINGYLSRNKEMVKENILVKKLDDLKIDNISFIKVDIEKHELEFLNGAKETLKKNNATVILEIPTRNKFEIDNHNECVNLMKNLGYIHYMNCPGSTKDYIFRKEK